MCVFVYIYAFIHMFICMYICMYIYIYIYDQKGLRLSTGRAHEDAFVIVEAV